MPLLLKKFLAAMETLAMHFSPIFLWLLRLGGVWSFAVNLKTVTGIWKGFGGLRDGGTGWNRCFGDLSALRIMVIWLSVIEGGLDVGVIFDYLRLGIFERGWKNSTHQVSLIPFG